MHIMAWNYNEAPLILIFTLQVLQDILLKETADTLSDPQ